MLGTLLIGLLGLQSRFFMNSTTEVSPQWIEIGKPLPNQTFSFGLLLTQNNVNTLEKLVDDRSNPNSNHYGTWMTLKEIDTIVSTNIKDYNIVTDWLKNTITNFHCIRI